MVVAVVAAVVVVSRHLLVVESVEIAYMNKLVVIVLFQMVRIQKILESMPGCWIQVSLVSS